MAKRYLTLVALLMLVVMLAVTGCGKQEAANSQQNTQKVYEFKMHHHQPPNSPIGVFFENWAKDVGAKSNGRIKITVYPGGSLGPGTQAYSMVTTGVCDIAWGVIALQPGLFPGSEMMHLPMLGLTSSKMAGNVLWDLYKNTDFLKKEYQNVQVLYFFTEGGTPIATRNKQINAMSDLQGLKIRTPGGPVMELMKKAGATPIGMPPQELYEALGKGVVDGYLIGWQGLDDFKLPENTKYFVDANLYPSTFWVLMNKNKYNALPDDLKKLMDDMSGAAAMGKVSAMTDQVEIEIKNRLDKQGIVRTPLSPTEKVKWEELSKEVQDKWVVDATAKGYPAKEALAKLKELIVKHADQK